MSESDDRYIDINNVSAIVCCSIGELRATTQRWPMVWLGKRLKIAYVSTEIITQMDRINCPTNSIVCVNNLLIHLICWFFPFQLHTHTYTRIQYRIHYYTDSIDLMELTEFDVSLINIWNLNRTRTSYVPPSPHNTPSTTACGRCVCAQRPNPLENKWKWFVCVLGVEIGVCPSNYTAAATEYNLLINTLSRWNQYIFVFVVAVVIDIVHFANCVRLIFVQDKNFRFHSDWIGIG